MKKLILIPILLTTTTPMISIVGCGNNEINKPKFELISSTMTNFNEANISINWNPSEDKIVFSEFLFVYDTIKTTEDITQTGSTYDRPCNLLIKFNEDIGHDVVGELTFHYVDETMGVEGEGLIPDITIASTYKVIDVSDPHHGPHEEPIFWSDLFSPRINDSVKFKCQFNAKKYNNSLFLFFSDGPFPEVEPILGIRTEHDSLIVGETTFDYVESEASEGNVYWPYEASDMLIGYQANAFVLKENDEIDWTVKFINDYSDITVGIMQAPI